jgi:hypothetical protein
MREGIVNQQSFVSSKWVGVDVHVHAWWVRALDQRWLRVCVVISTAAARCWVSIERGHIRTASTPKAHVRPGSTGSCSHRFNHKFSV